MDFSFNAGEVAFREEVRAWIRAAVPGDWGSEAWPIPTDVDAFHAALRGWVRTLHEGGWGGITWPRQYGGRGATPIEQFIFQEELACVLTPPLVSVIGVGMVGPTLMAWGTPDQKRAHLARILSGDEIWCQGFLEPNAGSDLASLTTLATVDGDHYRVTGQKVWTSYGDRADRCMLLVRTGHEGSKHDGITCLLVDMRGPGIEPRPLRQATGDAEFCEVFFNDVRVPVTGTLGPEGQGWRVARTTLMHERVNLAAMVYAQLKRTLADVTALARTTVRQGRPLSEDPHVRRALVRLHASVESQRLNNLRMRAGMSAKDDPGAIGSIFKLVWADAHQALCELPLEILGPHAELLGGAGAPSRGGGWMKAFLRSRASSIEGGTSEVLRNVLAERVLGLPR